MKQCPQCRKSYDDDSYEFCLEDGTVLVEVFDSQTPTVAFNEQETFVRNNQIQPTQPAFQNPQTQNSIQTQVSPLVVPPIQSAPPKSNTAQAVLLTIAGMLAVFGVGFGAWFFLGNREGEIAENKNININSNSNRSPSPKPSANANVNANVTKPTISPTPEIDSEAVKSEVSKTLYDWKAATESGDINDCMSHYTESINFYGSQKSRSSVRSDKQAAFNKYDSMSISLSNMRVSADASGEKATAVFDKEWVFSGEKVYAGKVQSQFQLIKSGGRWLITSEKDLKVYYVKK